MEFMYVPAWLKALLLLTSFFSDCEVHPKEFKNECNKLCINCCDKALCSHCIKSGHEGHRFVQVRKSSYHNVVRVQDIQNDLDIEDIQTYVINSFDVVFLNKRSFDMPKTKKISRNSKNTCTTCSRPIMEYFSFCSLGCKFAFVKEDESDNGSGSSESGVFSSKKVNGKKKMKELVEITKALEEDKDLREKTSAKSRNKKGSSNSRKRKGTPRRAPFY